MKPAGSAIFLVISSALCLAVWSGCYTVIATDSNDPEIVADSLAPAVGDAPTLLPAENPPPVIVPGTVGDPLPPASVSAPSGSGGSGGQSAKQSPSKGTTRDSGNHKSDPPPQNTSAPTRSSDTSSSSSGSSGSSSSGSSSGSSDSGSSSRTSGSTRGGR